MALKTPSLTPERRKELHLFEKHAEIRFRKLDFLNLAFSHRSFANENPDKIENNEKLEFLGDSVLGLVVADYLFRLYADHPEGELAKIKSIVVSEETLSYIARNLGLDKFILIGKGEEFSGGRNKKALLADAMEAVFGAYYLDSGFKDVKKFILRYIVPEIEKVRHNKHKKDYKTLLQEFVQKSYKTYPRYRLVKKSGPDHDRTFWVEVEVNGETYGPGKGKNKKSAEQVAAGVAYDAVCPGYNPLFGEK